MMFDLKKIGPKFPRKSSIVELLKSLAIITSGFSTIFLSSNPNELCDRLKLLLQEKGADNKSNIIIVEIDAKFDKLLEYKSIIPSEHKNFFKNSNYCTQRKKVKQVNVDTNVIFSTSFLT